MGQDGQQIDSFDFEAHRLRATADFQKVEPLYKEFAEVLRNLLLEAFKANHIQVHSIEARAKAVDSFGRKAFAPSEEDPSKPKYPNPLADMTDLAGARVITFFPRTLQDVDERQPGEVTLRRKIPEPPELPRDVWVNPPTKNHSVLLITRESSPILVETPHGPDNLMLLACSSPLRLPASALS